MTEQKQIQKVKEQKSINNLKQDEARIKKGLSKKRLGQVRGSSQDVLNLSDIKNLAEKPDEIGFGAINERNLDIIQKDKNENPMRNIEIEKIVLHCGGIDEKLEKSVKLLEKIAKTENIKRKIYIKKSTRRVPAFGISPGKKSGAKITFRNKKKIDEMLKKFFAALENRIKEKQITENQLGFGIKEYIEVPGLDYEREIGILGFEVMVVFKRKGKRVKMKKIKQGKYPKKQEVTKKEIIDFLIKNFKMEIE